MKHTTRFTPQVGLGRLEAKNGKRYSYSEIANHMAEDRQKIRYQLNNPLMNVPPAVIDKWLDFFYAEGLTDVSYSDLFTTERTD